MQINTSMLKQETEKLVTVLEDAYNTNEETKRLSRAIQRLVADKYVFVETVEVAKVSVEGDTITVTGVANASCHLRHDFMDALEEETDYPFTEVWSADTGGHNLTIGDNEENN